MQIDLYNGRKTVLVVVVVIHYVLPNIMFFPTLCSSHFVDWVVFAYNCQACATPKGHMLKMTHQGQHCRHNLMAVFYPLSATFTSCVLLSMLCRHFCNTCCILM